MAIVLYKYFNIFTLTTILTILTYVLMKTLCLIIFSILLVGAILATWFIKKEQNNRIGNKFLQMIRKFDSWQMMR